jgi:hypothetical protein
VGLFCDELIANASNTLKSAALYFAIVFGTGFLLALIRIPWLAPRFGVRVAELIEMPIMLMVIYFAARWLVRERLAAATKATRLTVGLMQLIPETAERFGVKNRIRSWWEHRAVERCAWSIRAAVNQNSHLLDSAVPRWSECNAARDNPRAVELSNEAKPSCNKLIVGQA